jgi:hypothetical protein
MKVSRSVVACLLRSAIVAGALGALAPIAAAQNGADPPRDDSPAVKPKTEPRKPRAASPVLAPDAAPPRPRGAPANDLCANAQDIGEGSLVFTTNLATTDGPVNCGGMGSDVWFRYTASQSGCAIISLCGSTYDTVLNIYNGGTCVGASLGCIDDVCGIQSELRTLVTAGGQYLIQAGGFNGATGDGFLTVTVGTPPGNDLCASAAPIGAGVHSFDTSFACTDGPDEGAVGDCGAFAPPSVGQDVWFRYTPASGGTVTVSMCGLTFFDSKLAAYGATCPTNPSTSLACNDDFCGLASASQITFQVAGGQQYLIRIGGYDNASGPGMFDVTLGAATGACCVGTACSVITQADCAAAAGTYAGDGTACPPSGRYLASTCTSAFEDISATGTPGAIADDDFVEVPVGFDFTFYNNTYNAIKFCTNGYLTFGPDGTDFSNDAIPNVLDPNDAIFPLWDDWRTDTTGASYYETRGAPPSRRFIAQWSGIEHFAAPPRFATFQAILFETSNRIEFRYNGWALVSPTIGVENIDGTTGTAIAPSSIGQVDCRKLVLCPCNWNGDNTLNSQDYFDFLTSFFGGSADFNRDCRTNSQDYFDFLTCFFTGCS